MKVCASFMLFVGALTVLTVTGPSDASKTQSFPVSRAHEDARRQPREIVAEEQAYSPRLLYANRKDIRIVQTNRKKQTTVVDGLKDAITVDFCYAEGYVFWSDVVLEKIKRIRVTGDTRKVEDVISVGLKKPEGLAVDWVARKLYWTDCRDSDWETNRIEVANLDGTNRKVLFWENLGLPRAIAVDPLLGYMFWTDWGEVPKIERAEMDGSNRRVIIRQDIHWPNGLTLDYSTGKIYWTDAKLLYIAKANYDGSNRERILRSAAQCSLRHPFALTLYENEIYWTDWKTRGIHSTNKNNGLRCPMVWSNAYSPMDIRAYEPNRQQPRSGKNPCNATTNGGCSHLCLLNTHGRSCACPTGVRLLSNQKTCEQGPVHFLLLARKVDLRIISLDTPDLTDVVVPVSDIRHAVAIDFDPVDKFVYWSDDEKLEIKRSRLDGTDVQVIIDSNIKHPDGVAVDWVARNLYWTDTGTDRIEVSRLNGSSRKVLINDYLDEPRAIALDPTHGHMYWTDWGMYPKIERAGLDGSHRVTLVNSSVVWPNSITIDFHEQKIYWADAKLDKIEVMNLDGSNRRVVLDDKLPHVFGFTVLGDRLYWTDWQRKVIESYNKRTHGDRHTIIDSLPDLMGLKAVNLSLTYGLNPCAMHNGGCSHLCLAKPGYRFVCSCPTHYTLSVTDNKTCRAPRVFMLYSTKTDIWRFVFNSTDNLDVALPVRGLANVIAIDYDINNHLVFWIDAANNTIRCAFQNGANARTIKLEDGASPYDLAIDSHGQQLFWTDSVSNSINVYSLRYRKSMGVVFREEHVYPRSIVLYPEKRQMFFTNENPVKMSIMRATMDGADGLKLFNADHPGDLAVDKQGNKLYWTDITLKKIEYGDLTGKNRATLLEMNVLQPVGLVVYGNYVYWIDRQTRNVMKIKKEGEILGSTVQAAIDDLSDMIIVDTKTTAINPSQKPKGRRPSGVKKGKAHSPRLLYASRKDIRIMRTKLGREDIRVGRTSHKYQDETIVVDGLDNAFAVDFCYAEGYVFWTDVILEKIKRIRVTGDTRKVEDVISVGLKKPEGLAVDWVARKLYWTDVRDSDWEKNRIEVANLDGTSRKVLLWKNLGLPRAIAVDPVLGYMFWTDWGEEPKIERAEMDGSNRRVIIKQDIHWPNGLTLDYNNKKVYWTDSKLLYIKKANYDGSNSKSIFKSAGQCVLGHPFALTLYENKIYWTDWKTRGIHSAKKRSGLRCQKVWSSTYSPMGIHAFEPKRQQPRPGKNPCNSTTNGGCSHLCLLNTRARSCACPTGVRLLSDQKTCEHGPVHFLLLARKVDLRHISLDTSDLTDVVVPVSDIRHAVAIDFDPVDKFIYWSDDKKLEIKRSRMDGTDVQVILGSDIKKPGGVAVDWVARNLYWTDTGTDRIEVSRLDGSSRKVLISENLDEPRAITLHPTNGYMYWTDWGKQPKIERAALDGSQRMTLVNSSLGWPNGITIDFNDQKIYWADAKLDKIEAMNLDGSNRRLVLGENLPHVFGLTWLGDRLYWTDWQRRAIESCNKRTGGERKTIVDSIPHLMDLKAVNLNFPYGCNPCQHNNGGCSHLCLFRPFEVKCECPEGMELLADKKNCVHRSKD